MFKKENKYNLKRSAMEGSKNGKVLLEFNEVAKFPLDESERDEDFRSEDENDSNFYIPQEIRKKLNDIDNKLKILRNPDSDESAVQKIIKETGYFNEEKYQLKMKKLDGYLQRFSSFHEAPGTPSNNDESSQEIALIKD